MSQIIKEARLLANYLESMNYKDFNFVVPTPYNHIGALFTDIILQSGLNYSNVVRPRVARIFRLFPDAVSVSAFELAIENNGINYVLNWNGITKADRILDLISYCKSENIESENDFRNYLLIPSNQTKLLRLKGVGPKTIDYALKLLCVDTVAVDRHVFSFVSKAGIKSQDYFEVKAIVEYAADLLKSSRIKLDSFIWRKMSGNSSSQGNLQFY